MFIETYYDDTRSGCERHRSAAYSIAPRAVWRRLGGVATVSLDKHAIGIYPFELGVPEPVQSEVKRLRATRLFDRIEIWACKDPDPMAVGIIAPDGGRTRYYSIARWGDAEITVAEVKRSLRRQEIVSFAILTAAILLVMTSIFLVFST
jgi:hypothetical protein